MRGHDSAAAQRQDLAAWEYQGRTLGAGSNLRRIRQVGRAAWKRESGYHRRSLAEPSMFRLKTIFSDRVTAHGVRGASGAGVGAL